MVDSQKSYSRTASEAQRTSIIIEWWAEQGSNLRPRPCKGRALPAELSARALIVTDLPSLVNL